MFLNVCHSLTLYELACQIFNRNIYTDRKESCIVCCGCDTDKLPAKCYRPSQRRPIEEGNFIEAINVHKVH